MEEEWGGGEGGESAVVGLRWGRGEEQGREEFILRRS